MLIRYLACCFFENSKLFVFSKVLGFFGYLFFSFHIMDIYAKLNAIQMMIDNNEITDEDFPYIQMVLKKMQEEGMH